MSHVFYGMNSKSETPPLADSDDGGRVVAAVNDDAWTEILLRLPGKSVTRFKLVCKHWLALISGDHFRRLHSLRHRKPQPSLLIRTRTSQFFYFNPTIDGENPMLPYSFSVPNPKILSSRNGLLLLQSDNPQSDYYVYNPTTKQSRKLSITENDKYIDVVGLKLAFDPSKSPHYKIVCLRKSPAYARSYQIEVYDSESRSWKLCLEPFAAPRLLNFSSGLHCNNSIYWPHLFGDVCCFDMDKKAMSFVPCPPIPRTDLGGDAVVRFKLLESNGNLYHFVVISERKAESVALWEWQRDGLPQWSLKYEDIFSHPQAKFGSRRCRTRILRIMRGSDTSLLIHQLGKVKIYSFLEKKYKELFDLESTLFNQDHLETFEVHQFGETLALV